jgi:hypothetical protein
MSNKIIEPVIKPPKIDIEKKILEEIKEQSNTEQQVIVHCYFFTDSFFTRYRVWPTTYLRDLHSSNRAELLLPINIPYYPQWKYITGIGKIRWTLIFSSLKDIKQFDLYEDIPTGNGFYSGTINRNETDVYQIEILY